MRSFQLLFRVIDVITKMKIRLFHDRDRTKYAVPILKKKTFKKRKEKDNAKTYIIYTLWDL